MRNEVELCSPMKRERATLGRRERIRSEIGRRRRSLRPPSSPSSSSSSTGFSPVHASGRRLFFSSVLGLYIRK